MAISQRGFLRKNSELRSSFLPKRRIYFICFTFAVIIYTLNFFLRSRKLPVKEDSPLLKTFSSAYSFHKEKKTKNVTLPSIPEDSVFKAHRLKCIHELQNDYRSLIGGYIKNKHVFLLDTVDHENLGDSFIQVGEVLFIKEFQSFTHHKACSLASCNITHLIKEVNAHNDSIILIHGGGNFGDIWRVSTTFKVKLMYYLSKKQIIFLPQSIYYKNIRLVKYDAMVFNRHTNMRLFVRDEYSLNLSTKYFPNLKPRLCPDAAFMIGPIDKSQCSPYWDVMFLVRTDIEKQRGYGSVMTAKQILDNMNVSSVITDWFTWAHFIGNRTMPKEPLLRPDLRLRVGIELLCKARVIVTDRLHVVILSTLMGIPHVFLDNMYGKVHAYRDSIFGPKPNCQDAYLQGWSARSWNEAATTASKIIINADLKLMRNDVRNKTRDDTYINKEIKKEMKKNLGFIRLKNTKTVFE